MTFWNATAFWRVLMLRFHGWTMAGSASAQNATGLFPCKAWKPILLSRDVLIAGKTARPTRVLENGAE